MGGCRRRVADADVTLPHASTRRDSHVPRASEFVQSSRSTLTHDRRISIALSTAARLAGSFSHRLTPEG